MSKAWKNLERQTARVLGGQRVLRLTAPLPSFVSATDVVLPMLPNLRVDCKYRSGGFAHHRLVEQVRSKYCRVPGQVPVLVTKSRNQRGAYVVVPLDFFRELLDAYAGRKNS